MVIPESTFTYAIDGLKFVGAGIPVLKALRGEADKKPEDASLREFISKTRDSVINDVTAARQEIIALRDTLRLNGIPEDRSLRSLRDDYAFMTKLLHLPTWRLLQRATRAVGAATMSMEGDVGDAVTILACMGRQELIFAASRDGVGLMAGRVGDLNETKLDRPLGEVLERIIDTANWVLGELPQV